MFQRKNLLNEYIERLMDSILEMQEQSWDLIFGLSTSEVKDQAIRLHSLCYELFQEACDLETHCSKSAEEARTGLKQLARRALSLQGDLFTLKVFDV